MGCQTSINAAPIVPAHMPKPQSVPCDAGTQTASAARDGGFHFEDTALGGQENGFHKQYMLGQALGRGAFSQVHLVTKRDTGEECAVKIVKLQKANNKDGNGINCKRDSELVRISEAEIKALRHVGQGAHVVNTLAAFMDNVYCYIVMERCDLTLLRRLQRSPEVNEEFLADAFSGMLSGLAHCHRANVVHRDIKPDNYLCKLDPFSPNGRMSTQVRLCDFGFAAVATSDKALKGIFGTAPFMSPEMLQKEYYGKPSDVWSFGVMMYVLMLGRFPYVSSEATSAAMKRAILLGEPKPSFEACVRPMSQTDASGRSQRWPTGDAEAMLRGILHRDPRQRPSCDDVLQSTFFRRPSGSWNPASLRPMIMAARQTGAFNDGIKLQEASKELRDMQVSAALDEHREKCDRERSASPGRPSSMPSTTASPLPFGGTPTTSSGFESEGVSTSGQ
eukprot:TRINITY_DN9461_c0_g2_i1.p1 TRINITY_DN9461_c0_g2~~TRINITY_DN9461_c0_g2_i1.p1  ORF type:complete len:448 (-),score=87.71 TRINITY_DN9461_c0_g2_i1:174-1517(-)